MIGIEKFFFFIISNTKYISSDNNLDEKIINTFIIIFDVLNIFFKALWGLIYDRYKFKKSLILFNYLTLIISVLTLFSYENSYIFGFIAGFSFSQVGGVMVILNTSALEIFGEHGYYLLSIVQIVNIPFSFATAYLQTVVLYKIGYFYFLMIFVGIQLLVIGLTYSYKEKNKGF